MTEDISGFNYQISNFGRVKNNKGKLIKPHINKCGYIELHLGKDGKHYNRKIHRLVAEAFIPNPDQLPQVDHIDTDKANNIVSNLRWVTSKENNNNPKTIQNKRCGNAKNKITQVFSTSGYLLYEFMSASEAARQLGMDRRKLCYLAQHNRSFNKYIFKYKE